MTLAQVCTRFLGAAILLIAVSLLPSPAWAHGPHGQHGGQVFTSAVHHDHAISKSAGAAGRVVSSEKGALAVAAAKAPAGPGDTESGCVVGCCVMGAGCCPGVMAVAAVPQMGPLPQARRMRPRHLAVAGGIDPEALRKPPRSLV